jgi:hypothetical protein
VEVVHLHNITGEPHQASTSQTTSPQHHKLASTHQAKPRTWCCIFVSNDSPTIFAMDCSWSCSVDCTEASRVAV